MATHKTRELEGAKLDCAVALAGKEWEHAHELFPAMTLDPTFKDAHLVTFSDGRELCILQPNNPMRQESQPYSPSTDWEIGGPLIEREHIELICLARGGGFVGEWLARTPVPMQFVSGPTPLIAAMRALVVANLGEEVELP